MLHLVLVAETATAPVDWTNPITWVTVGGPLAILSILLITGRLVTKAELDRVVEDKKAAEAERDRAQKVLQEDLIPVLVKFTEQVAELLPYLRGYRSDEKEVGYREGYDRPPRRRT